MTTVRLGVIGAGAMAARRARAFLATGRVTICGIASRTIERARACGEELGCDAVFTDARQLYATLPDAVLLEVPHRLQDVLTIGALEAGAHVLIGGCLASSVAAGTRIRDLARSRDLVVETGYEARYKEVWLEARARIAAGAIGTVVAVNSIALFPADPASWYYSEVESGGMPLTHMTYAFINPARWLFGEPRVVSAFANRLVETGSGRVAEETCTANLLFPDAVVCNMTAGYVCASGTWWSFTVIGSDGVIEVRPSDAGPGEFLLHRGGQIEHRQFAAAADAFVTQANAFLDAIEGTAPCLNPPADSLRELRTIAVSAPDVFAPPLRPAPAAHA
jgi:predicted dehydrogenase